MEVYNKTGVTKSGAVRVTKAIGALNFKTSAALTTETIKLYVERSNGDNVIICEADTLLKDFIDLSVFDEGAIHVYESQIQSAITELGLNGVIPLASNEAVVIELDNLVALNTYVVNGIEFPAVASAIHLFESKRVLDDEKRREFNVRAYDLVKFNNFDKVRNVMLQYGQNRVNYTPSEFIALALDLSPANTYDTYLGEVRTTSNYASLVFPIIGVDIIEIEKIKGTVDMLLKGTF